MQEKDFDDVTAVLALPKRYIKWLTTNGVERINEEFAMEAGTHDLPESSIHYTTLGALFMEIDKKWSTGHCFFEMPDFWTWQKELEMLKNDASTSQNTCFVEKGFYKLHNNLNLIFSMNIPVNLTY
jgi:hypothetical protein